MTKLRCFLWGHDFRPEPQWAVEKCARCGHRWSRLQFCIEGPADPLEIYKEPSQ